MNVEENIRSKFAAIVNVNSGELQLDVNLFEAYGLDSVRALKLISDVEVEFDVDLSEEESRSICTLGDVVGLVEAKLGQSV